MSVRVSGRSICAHSNICRDTRDQPLHAAFGVVDRLLYCKLAIDVVPAPLITVCGRSTGCIGICPESATNVFDRGLAASRAVCDTTRARLAQATELLELVRNQTRTVADPADPWRGLYHPSRLPARNADGEILCHPDVPMWADGREVSLRPLFLAQGFDLVVVEGEFSEEGLDHQCPCGHRSIVQNWKVASGGERG